MQKLLENLPKIPLRQAQGYSHDLGKLLPESAGIYAYFKNSNAIYIGKAINLKRRISSYFDLNLEPKTKKMVSEAESISFIQVSSEFEALLLEAKLIRAYMPHYNIAAKDDKHALYVVITNEEFPRILSVRKLMANGYQLLASYGPFPSSKSVYEVLRMLRRIFPYSDHKVGKRGCIYSHIGLCNPCPSEIVQSTEYSVLRKKYLKNIRNIKYILDGNIDKVVRNLEKEMNTLSKSEKYEEAAKVRNQKSHLEYITRPQMPTEFYMQNPNLLGDIRKKELTELKNILKSEFLNLKSIQRIECFDIAHLAGTNTTASMVTFIDGEADKSFYRHFKIKKVKGGDDYASLREVAKIRTKHFEDWGVPDLIIVDGGVGQVKSFTSILYSNKVKITVIGIAKHPDRLIVGEKKIKLGGAALNLVLRMRDEAHRFARRYHHGLISKSITHANNN